MKAHNTHTMSISDLQDRLRIFARRAQALCGRTVDGQPLGTAVSKFFTEMLEDNTDPVKVAQRNEFLEKAQKDPVARQQLCGIRIETFSNYILAAQNIIPMFFEIVNLGMEERPVIQNTTEQEIKVGFIGADGGLKTVKVAKDDDEVLINLHFLTTERVRYRRTDVYRGTIVDAALKVLRMAYDMANQMEGQAAMLLMGSAASGGAFGAFTFTGKKANYTYLANSRIVTGNLPTTNDIVLSGNSSSTKFRYQVFRAARKYADQWVGCFPEGPLVPTGRILVPSLEASDIAEEIVPSGSTNNRVADQLLEDGYAKIDYLGKNWTLVADNTLQPKTCYVEYNRKPGRVYLKPSLDREIISGEGVYELDERNEEERWMQKVFGCYVNSWTRTNVARIKYTT